MIKLKIFIVVTFFYCAAIAQQVDTTTILIYDSTTTKDEFIDMSKYSDSTLTLMVVTGDLDELSEKTIDVQTRKLFKITKRGEYLYNYDKVLSPVTELSFYYKLLEHEYLPGGTVSAQEWQQLSLKMQRKKLRKYSTVKVQKRAA